MRLCVCECEGREGASTCACAASPVVAPDTEADTAQVPATAQTLMQVLEWHARRHPQRTHVHLLGEGAKHLLHNAPGLNFVLYAVVLICALRFLPQGLVGLAARIGTFRKKEDDNA